MARPIRVSPQQHNTIPVAMLESDSVKRTGPSTGASGCAATIRSASDDARMPVIAAVELSGAPTANGSELPSAITAARIAEEMKVAATPYDKNGASGPAKISSE